MEMTAFTMGAVFLTLFLHSFVLYPITLLLVRAVFGRREIRAADKAAGSMALCFCAYNEEAILPAKIRNLAALKQADPSLSILAYVDGATDRSAELLLAERSWIQVINSPVRLGKSHGMNRLIRLARSDILVFTDANVMLDRDALLRLRPYFGDPQVGCVCGHLRYTNGDASSTAQTGSLYWRFEEMIKQLETDTGSAVGADGSIFAVRRSLHPGVRPDIIDDFFVSLSILCDGHRVVRAPDVLAWEASVTSAQEEFRRKIRIACQAFNVHRLLWPRIRRAGTWNLYKYVSHKLLRWLSIYFLALGLACLAAALALGGYLAVLAFLAGGGALGAFAGIALRLKPFSTILAILLSLLATGLGVLESLRGKRFQTWLPAKSIRTSGTLPDDGLGGRPLL